MIRLGKEWTDEEGDQSREMVSVSPRLRYKPHRPPGGSATLTVYNTNISSQEILLWLHSTGHQPRMMFCYILRGNFELAGGRARFLRDRIGRNLSAEQLSSCCGPLTFLHCVFLNVSSKENRPMSFLPFAFWSKVSIGSYWAEPIQAAAVQLLVELEERSRNGRFISLQFRGGFTRLQLRRRHNVEAYNQSSCLFTSSFDGQQVKGATFKVLL